MGIEHQVLDYQVTRKQLAFMNALEREIMYGGAAGGGKTAIQVIDAGKMALQYPGIRQLILRRTYEELEESILPEIEEKYPPHLWTYNESKHRGRWFNGSTIKFGYLARDKDLRGYQSAQYDVIRFDELTHFTKRQYTYMMSRVRGKNNFPKQIKSTTNPGSEGHAWVKARFVDPAPPNTSFIDGDMSRIFIPAKVEDNLFLRKYNPEYIEWLNQLEEHERAALRDGRWDVFFGQYFTAWRYEKHTLRPFEIPKSWRRFRAMDWGFKDPCCVLWFAVTPSGRVIIYRELYVTKTLSRKIAEMIIELSEGEEIAYTAASPDIWRETGHTDIDGKTIAETFGLAGVPLIKADNTRVPGWQQVREFLEDADDGRPRLYVFQTCLNLIRTLPEMIYSERFVEDIADNLEDHAPEALRYGLMTRPSPAKPKPKVKPVPYDPFDRGKTNKNGFTGI